jgi:hypothetical protein
LSAARPIRPSPLIATLLGICASLESGLGWLAADQVPLGSELSINRHRLVSALDIPPLGGSDDVDTQVCSLTLRSMGHSLALRQSRTPAITNCRRSN